MSIPFTLLFYIGRVFLLHVLVVSLSIILICFIGFLSETARRLVARDIADPSIIIEMAFAQTPSLVEIAFPFVFLISAMSCFFSLTRRHELDAARIGGISAWLFISPALVISLVAGGLIVSLYNPMSAALAKNYYELKAQYILERANLFSLAETGIWLRQGDGAMQSIIHATRASAQGVRLFDVTIFLYEDQGHFTGRLDAKQAELETGKWRLQDVWITPANGLSHFVEQHEEATTLTPDHVYDSVSPPETISFWNLGRFIDLAKAAGLQVSAYEFHWYRLMTMPFFLFGMVLLGASVAFFFSARRGGETWLIISTISFALVIYALIFLGNRLAASAALSVMFAAWAPIILAAGTGFILFLQKEEG